MANGWTPERRARQAALIQSWRPWERSSGPKSDSGRARASRNAFNGAERPALRQLVAAANAALLGQKRQLIKLAVAEVDASQLQ
jgi:hypothetical protein